MKIRRCPGCAQLVHFEENRPVESCWNCRRISDFSAVKSVEERFGLWLLSGVENVLAPLFLWTAKAGKVALVVAMPIAILMLLLCNSFDIHVVHDLTASFSCP